jgi:hypothetical protein
MQQVLPPSPDCYRLGHSIQHVARNAGTGKIEFCAVCSLGYEMALASFSHKPGVDAEAMADQFVRELRSERLLLK